MVSSILIGLPAIIAEIEKRILACVPTAFSTDTWVKADRKQYEAQNDLLTDYWRHFDLEIIDSDPSSFQGNYAYQNREIQLDVYTWYTVAGANRVAGNPDVDWQALMMQDAHDLQHALRAPIVTSDGSTGRLIYDNANRSEDDQEATLVVSFRLPCFLRGTAQVPELYLGPNQNPTLNAGETFYLVAQSDLACSAALSSSPAGCTHETALELGSGVPQVIEVTCDTPGTYSFTLTSSSGTATCTVHLYQASDFVLVGPDQAVPNDQWTLNIAVAAANDGVYPVTGSANLTLPENVTIVNNKGVIPVTINSRGSHSVSVGGDICNFTSATPATKIPYYNNQYYQIDPVYNSGTEAGIFSGGAGDYANVYNPDDNGDLFFTFAYRYRPIENTIATGSWFAASCVGTSTNYANWAVNNYTYLQRPSLHFRNFENTTTRAYYVNSWQTFNNWHDVVIAYQYNVNTQTGMLYFWTDGVQNPVGGAALGALDRMGWIHNDAITKTKTIRFMISGIGRFEFCDVYISNNYAWNSDDVAAFVAKSTIDPDHYTLYWPLQKNTDLPYLVDYDRKNNVPLYIPGPHPEIEWVAKP